nr:MAG TPA: ferric uptake regulation protein [Caudoviricetes sp.]
MEKEEIETIARVAAVEALKKRDAIVDEEIDARYHDVKLLMKNYRKLKAHYAHVSPEALEVSSICSMRRKTGLMMSHVDRMLDTYKVLCQQDGNPDEERRWQALYLRYVADEHMNIAQIADKLHIDKRTFYRDIGKAMEDMAVLLFGLEAIGTWKHHK